jgi:putative spermidine/putrescine transport system substrate-binding protein
MRKNWCIKTMVLVLAMVLALAGCGSDESSNGSGSGKEFDGRTLTIASYGGALDETVVKHVVEKFKEETGAEVVLDPSYQFGQLISEKESPSVDLAYLDDARVIEAGDLGLLEKLDPSKISNWDNLYPEAIDKGQYGVAWVFGSYGIVYNKDKVDKEPTSWDDLWNSAYKGKIAVNDLVSNGGVQAFVAAGKLDGGDEKNIDPSFERYKELAPNLLTVSASTAQLTDMLTRGEVWIAPWWDGRALNLQDNIDTIGFVRPEEGAYATIVEFSIPKGTKNADMAYKFIDMALDAEAQKGFAEDMYYGPTNKTVELPEELASRVVYGDDVKDLQFVDWKYIATVRSEWINRWNQEVLPLLQ